MVNISIKTALPSPERIRATSQNFRGETNRLFEEVLSMLMDQVVLNSVTLIKSVSKCKRMIQIRKENMAFLQKKKKGKYKAICRLPSSGL
jgi:hypothetical protein